MISLPTEGAKGLLERLAGLLGDDVRGASV